MKNIILGNIKGEEATKKDWKMIGEELILL